MGGLRDGKNTMPRANPYRPAGLLALVLLLASCSGGAEGAASSIDTNAALRAEAARWYGDSPLGGLVAVVRMADGTEYVLVLGHGDGQQALTANEVFRLGSVTKTLGWRNILE